jgi:hypothetical protein
MEFCMETSSYSTAAANTVPTMPALMILHPTTGLTVSTALTANSITTTGNLNSGALTATTGTFSGAVNSGPHAVTGILSSTNHYFYAFYDSNSTVINLAQNTFYTFIPSNVSNTRGN